MIKILIADDHPIVRMGMKKILEKAADMTVTDEASNGAEVLNKVFNNHFDIVLLDISMPGRSGLEVLSDIKKEKPDLPVLILTMYPEEEYAIRSLKTGAAGYLTKESAPFELITAIRKVSAGQKYISSSLASLLAVHLETGSEKKPHETLSNREFQVMCLICSGKSLTKIGESLCLSLRTISTYRIRILDKMNMSSNAELTRYAYHNDLID